MDPVYFPEANAILRAPAGATNIEDLPVAHVRFGDGASGCVSCWQLTDQELEDIIKTRRVYLTVLARLQPPVSVSVNNPLKG